MEICDKFLCVNRKNKECHVPKNVVAFTCKHTNAPCPKARCEYCDVKECEKQYNGRIDRMSMISEQVKELRKVAENFREWEYNRFYDVISEAADTIESLSAKLLAANMERPSEDCDGWIPCKERLPEETGFYMVTKKIKETGERFSGKSRFDIEKGWNDPLNFVDIVAWRFLLEPYHEP